MSEPKELRFTEGEVEWVGATIRDGGEGRFLFGRDSNGALHVEIVCDHTPTGGIVQKNRVLCPDGFAMAKWLNDWFDPPEPPMVTIV